MAVNDERDAFAGLLARRRGEIEARWRKRVKSERVDGLDLEGALGEYVEKLAKTLSHPHAIEEEAQVWIESAREPTEQSFDVRRVIRALEILRDVILEIAVEESPDAPLDRIVHALDVPIEATVASYVQARDREARRTEARHICFLTHELRNPLAVATLAVAQLRRMGLSSPAQERAAELIERSLGRLRLLIEGAAPVEPWRA